MSTGGPVVLEPAAGASWKHALGWEDRSERRGGRCFIIVKATFTSFRVIQRFPMTDAGWRQAWKALVKLDRDGAVKALEVLADRADAASRKADLAGLAAQTISVVADGRYIPGSGELPGIASGSRVDVRFIADEVVFLSWSAAPRVLARFSYSDVVTVDVGGPGRVMRGATGRQIFWGTAIGLETKILASMATQIKTVVRFETTRCELFVVVSHSEPDALRMQLSPALWAIREAREAAGQPGAGGSPDAADDDGTDARADGPVSVVDQLAKLASLLESGLLTREEFDRLKDALLAGLDGGPPAGQEEKRFTVDLGRSAWPGVPSVAPIPPVPPTADPPFTPGWPGPGAG
jgi:hypothetical protein